MSKKGPISKGRTQQRGKNDSIKTRDSIKDFLNPKKVKMSNNRITNYKETCISQGVINKDQIYTQHNRPNALSLSKTNELASLLKEGELSQLEISNKLDISKKTIIRYKRKLISKGLIKSDPARSNYNYHNSLSREKINKLFLLLRKKRILQIEIANELKMSPTTVGKYKKIFTLQGLIKKEKLYIKEQNLTRLENSNFLENQSFLNDFPVLTAADVESYFHPESQSPFHQLPPSHPADCESYFPEQDESCLNRFPVSDPAYAYDTAHFSQEDQWPLNRFPVSDPAYAYDTAHFSQEHQWSLNDFPVSDPAYAYDTAHFSQEHQWSLNDFPVSDPAYAYETAHFSQEHQWSLNDFPVSDPAYAYDTAHFPQEGQSSLNDFPVSDPAYDTTEFSQEGESSLNNLPVLNPTYLQSYFHQIENTSLKKTPIYCNHITIKCNAPNDFFTQSHPFRFEIEI